MYAFKFITLGFMASAVIATNISPLLFSRQLTKVPCSEIFKKDCGDGCIDLTDTCCPQQQGGCPLLTYCVVGDNGLDGCCKIGKVCVGDGGTNTDASTYTSVRTSTYTIESSTRDFQITTSSSSSSSTTSAFFSQTSSTSSPTISATRTTTSTARASTSTAPPLFTGGSSANSVDAPVLPIAAVIFAAVFAY